MKIKKYFMLIIICLLFFNNTIQANSLIYQRNQYKKIINNINENKINIAYKLIKKIQKYPLYPDLKLFLLSKNLNNETSERINKFLKKYPDITQVQTIKENFINILANNKNWKELLKFSPTKPKSLQSCCNWYYAKLNYGNKKQAFNGIKNIFLQHNILSLPLNCQKIFSIWKSSGKIPIEIILEKIYLSMKLKNDKSIKYFIKILKNQHKTLASLIMNLWNNPTTLKSFNKKIKSKNFSKKFIILTFKKLASKHINTARNIIPFLIQKQLTPIYKQKLEEIIVWQLLNNNLKNKEIYWCDNVIKNSKSVSLIERRIRLAIYKNNMDDLNYWINKLPKKIKQKSKWQYWQADNLIKLGYKKQAYNIFKKLLFKNNFYSMVVAQRLNLKYPIKINITNFNTSNIKINELSRINELMYWKYNTIAINEWNNLIKNKNFITQKKLAFYANKKNWWHLSIIAIIHAKAWNNLKERFPLAWKKHYYYFTKNKKINQSYAMSIARQESAWNPVAYSISGAIGLMQITPIAAKDIIKIYKMNIILNNDQLFDPLININIGTKYLEYLYKKTGNNRIFSSIAFNAGLSRLHKWQEKSTGCLNPIAFIETIPFKETRNYVKQVLTYNVFYNYLMGKKTKIFTKNEWNFNY